MSSFMAAQHLTCTKQRHGGTRAREVYQGRLKANQDDLGLL
jgi:hypothetical protein